MKWTTTKILSFVVTCGGFAYGFYQIDPQTMILLVGMGVGLQGGKTFLQDRKTKNENK